MTENITLKTFVDVAYVLADSGYSTDEIHEMAYTANGGVSVTTRAGVLVHNATVGYALVEVN